MALELGGKTIAELETLQYNYLQREMQGNPQYLAITEELDRRRSGVFDMQKTIAFLHDKARRREFVSYKELSDHYGMTWSVARRPIAPHLDSVCDYAHGRGWPLLSAIVVNKENLATGKLEPDALSGFMKSANKLGFISLDNEAFLADQQRLVFEWAIARDEP